MKKRFDGIDAIRGIALGNMIIFHFLYDVFMVFEKDTSWIYKPYVFLWQQSICWTFILISGFVWSWGQKTAVKRGFVLNLWGFVITAVTVLFIPSETIWFGILNFMGIGVWLVWLFQKPLARVPPLMGMIIAFFLFLVFRNIPNGYLGFGRWVVSLPDCLYTTRVLTPIGFPFSGFSSGDYFPVLPWFFLYLTGYFGEKLFRKSELLQMAACVHVPVLSTIGRNTLLIYLLHQPLCYGVCCLFFR